MSSDEAELLEHLDWIDNLEDGDSGISQYSKPRQAFLNYTLTHANKYYENFINVLKVLDIHILSKSHLQSRIKYSIDIHFNYSLRLLYS